MALNIFDRDFDRHAESWSCPKCHHDFELVWDPNTISMRISTPIEPVEIDWACHECLTRLASAGYDTKRSRRLFGSGAVVSGVNAD